MPDSNSVFESAFFIGNRQKLAARSKAKLIVIVAHAELQSSADIAFPFRQDSTFHYLTGLDYPELLLVIDVENGEEWIIGPKTEDAMYDVFNGAFDREAATRVSGITAYYGWREGWPKLVARAKQTGLIHTLQAPPRYVTPYKMFSNPARARFTERIKQSVKSIAFEDMRPLMAELRQIKQAPEVAALQKAVDISADAYAAAWDARLTLANEYNFEALMEFEFRNRGGRGTAYDSIVAGGKNACTLHYVDNNSPIDQNELLLIDAGADYGHYAADITRTFTLNKPNARQRAVIDCVYRVQQELMAIAKPGVNRREFEETAESLIGTELKKLKVISTATRANIRQYYPHAVSHFLGLDTHDIGDYQEPFRAGMVMTIEPGIYIPEENIGVRIEDDILITTDGNTNLSKNIPLYAE